MDSHARKLNAFLPLSERELDVLAQLQTKPFHVKVGKELVHEGQTGHMAYVLEAAYRYTYKLLPNGGRQIIRFPLPGDWIGLRSALLRTSVHSFSALTDVVALNGADVIVKDSKRYVATKGWGFYNFNHSEPKAKLAKVMPRDKCAFCHESGAKKDMVWTQFYRDK